jgi:hypothetical protein
MAFTRIISMKRKIGINDRITDQINNFNYLDYNVLYEEEDLNMKTVNSARVLKIINQVFKPSLIFHHTEL